MANSLGGGALIVGVEDKTGRVLGTELDVDWLRQAIYSQISVAPDISAHQVDGLRVLVVLVSEASEPVEDTAGRLRWRVGDSCLAVDRSKWWQHRERARGFDRMATVSPLGPESVRPNAMAGFRLPLPLSSPLWEGPA